MSASIIIVGAGFSGAVVARELADAGIASRVVDSRSHVAGNAHTERRSNGVMVHVYGPHIFHTGDDHVWEYINRFGDMVPYITSKADSTIDTPVSFEDQALKFVGRELYEAFFKGYTQKQWGVSPTELPASILARLPVRFTYEDSYFNHPYQAIPRDGYTPIVEAILDHPLIEVSLNTTVTPSDVADAEHVFWSGPIDQYFEGKFGALGYRTLDFVESSSDGDYQGCPVMNYCDVDVPYTRITEHKHFAPWENHAGTTVYTEYSRLAEGEDIPYYPIRQVEEKKQLGDYVAAAQQASCVTFLGRLGTYRYLDMDVTIKEALEVAKIYLSCRSENRSMPPFVVNPL